jgi:hypothetical protein
LNDSQLSEKILDLVERGQSFLAARLDPRDSRVARILRCRDQWNRQYEKGSVHGRKRYQQ